MEDINYTFHASSTIFSEEPGMPHEYVGNPLNKSYLPKEKKPNSYLHVFCCSFLLF